jgi:putative sporulation protein YyaC
MDAANLRVPVQDSVGERFFISQAGALELVRDCFERTAGALWRECHDELVIVAIGTDRSTGDALGPLVGTTLEGQFSALKIPIFGTLQQPVHAGNLEDTLARIRRRWKRPFLTALDACLGSMEHVGSIIVGAGPLQPGAGVNKQLPEVGDMHITGVVNVSGFMEYFVLQNTRLGLVMSMAELIAQAVGEAVYNLRHRLAPARSANN